MPQLNTLLFTSEKRVVEHSLSYGNDLIYKTMNVQKSKTKTKQKKEEEKKTQEKLIVQNNKSQFLFITFEIHSR